jgi:hypothetical protein
MIAVLPKQLEAAGRNWWLLVVVAVVQEVQGGDEVEKSEGAF